MPNDPVEIATRIVKLIHQKKQVRLSDLEERAKKHKLSMATFDLAMSGIHKLKNIKRVVKGNDIVYSIVQQTEPKIKTLDCLVWINNLAVLPTGEFKKENNILYVQGRVLTPNKLKIDTIWFKPTDIGLPDNDLPLPPQAQPELIPFEAIPEQAEVYNPYVPSWHKKRKSKMK